MDIIGVTFINLFLIPFISVAIFAKRSGRHLKFDADFVVRYACITACLVPVVKAVNVLLGKVLSIEIMLYSGYYTIVAVAVAALLPYFTEFFRKCFKLSCKIEYEEK